MSEENLKRGQWLWESKNNPGAGGWEGGLKPLVLVPTAFLDTHQTMYSNLMSLFSCFPVAHFFLPGQ